MARGGAPLGLGPGCLIFLAPGLGCGLQGKTAAPLEQAKGQGSPRAAECGGGIYILPGVDHMPGPLGQAMATKGKAGM